MVCDTCFAHGCTPELCGEVNQSKIETQQVEQDVLLRIRQEYSRWSGSFKANISLLIDLSIVEFMKPRILLKLDGYDLDHIVVE
jgi:hypothetical protein